MLREADDSPHKSATLSWNGRMVQHLSNHSVQNSKYKSKDHSPDERSTCSWRKVLQQPQSESAGHSWSEKTADYWTSVLLTQFMGMWCTLETNERDTLSTRVFLTLKRERHSNFKRNCDTPLKWECGDFWKKIVPSFQMHFDALFDLKRDRVLVYECGFSWNKKRVNSDTRVWLTLNMKVYSLSMDVRCNFDTMVFDTYLSLAVLLEEY